MEKVKTAFIKDRQYFKFCFYGLFKNLRFFEPFLLVFFLSKNLDYWQIGLLYTVREITRNLLEIPSGIFSDSLGRRSTLAFSFLLYLASYVTFYLCDQYLAILLAMFFYGVADAFRSGTHKSMIYSYLDMKGWHSYKAAYYGNTRSWSQMGSAITSLGGAAFIWYSGNYSSVFLLSLVPASLDIFLIMSYPRFLEGKSIRTHKQTAKESFREIFQLLWKQAGRMVFWQHTNLAAFHSAYYRTIKDYLQPILATMAVSIPLLSGESRIRREALWIGLFYFSIYLMSSLASRNAGKVAGLIKSPVSVLRLTTYIGLSIGITGGILAWQKLTITAVIVLIGIFIIENLRKPIGVANLADNTHEDTWATVLSLESQTVSLYAALMAPLLGVVADIRGPGFGLAVLSGAALLLILLIDFNHQINISRKTAHALKKTPEK